MSESESYTINRVLEPIQMKPCNADAMSPNNASAHVLHQPEQ